MAGFGVFVCTPTSEGLSPGREATLATHLAVKQDGMDLYGFKDPADRDFLELLLTVSGVGPKTALFILRRAPRVYTYLNEKILDRLLIRLSLILSGRYR